MTIQLTRRTIALALAAFLAFAAVATTSLVLTLSRNAEAGAGYSDTPPWVADHAAWLADNGIASGFPGNLFKPNDNITRGQAAFWFGNYNDAIESVVGTTPAAAGLTPGATVKDTQSCPAGKRAIGGGQGDALGFTQTRGLPLGDFWGAGWQNTSGGNLDFPETTIVVVCAPDPIP